MNIFDAYQSRESLLKDIEAAIVEEQGEDGATVFRLPNKVAEALKAKYDAEVKNAKSQREKKQDAESRLAELTELRNKELLELEELRKTNPSDLRSTLQKYVEETTQARGKIMALEQELKPLRAQNEEFKAKETRRRIEAELVENATKLNCCETAMRDVKRLAPMFHLNDAGVAVTDDGKLVVEVLQEEVEKSPHWLKRSQGGGSRSGTSTGSMESRFQEALRGSSFHDVIANAPRQNLGY